MTRRAADTVGPAGKSAQTANEIRHASCVGIDGRAVLITGRSGSGKSSLALQLVGLGAGLVADDRVIVSTTRSGPVASAPDTLRGLIEVRGVGIVRVASLARCAITLAVDLDQTETERLPETREIYLAGTRIPLLFRVDGPTFPHAILQVLRAGRMGA